MASYDRLFPSQDTLPKGGFGNLIALPLQCKAREQANTVFVDDVIGYAHERYSADTVAAIRAYRAQYGVG